MCMWNGIWIMWCYNNRITETIQVIPVYDAPLSLVRVYVLYWQPTLELTTPWTSGWTGYQPEHHEHPWSCHDGMHTCPVVLVSYCTVTMEIENTNKLYSNYGNLLLLTQYVQLTGNFVSNTQHNMLKEFYLYFSLLHISLFLVCIRAHNHIDRLKHGV